MNDFPNKNTRPVFVLTTVIAFVLAHLFFWGHGLHLVHDSRGYYELSKIISENGLFNFRDAKSTMNPAYYPLFEIRTYGYPLFVALCSLFTNRDPVIVQLVVFEIQFIDSSRNLLLVCFAVANRCPRPRICNHALCLHSAQPLSSHSYDRASHRSAIRLVHFSRPHSLRVANAEKRSAGLCAQSPAGPSWPIGVPDFPGILPYGGRGYVEAGQSFYGPRAPPDLVLTHYRLAGVFSQNRGASGLGIVSPVRSSVPQ